MNYLSKVSIAIRLPRDSETYSTTNTAIVSDLTTEEQQIAAKLGISAEFYAKVRDTRVQRGAGDNENYFQDKAVSWFRFKNELNENTKIIIHSIFNRQKPAIF